MNLKLNNTQSIDLEKLIDSKLLIQANSGGGKSWAIRRLLEQSHGKVQQIILDPEGEFSTLKEKYEYILCGKDKDVAVSVQAAGMLSHRLLEFKISAIIDLYELHPQDRKRFVRLFLDAMVNAPKELWHPVLVVIDEAHVFAPEKGKSEALASVIGLASLGRKRGFGAILATQRISKLHKDAAAECNNKLIGRTGLDIDRKRAAEEIGFISKEDVLSLRTLEPGEFYAFGPAISSEVIKFKVGDIQTSHPRAGSRAISAPIPPTEKVRGILSKLADLPQEAKKQAQTMEELKTEIHILKAHRCPKVAVSQAEIDSAVRTAVLKHGRDWERIIKSFKVYSTELLKIINSVAGRANSLSIPHDLPPFTMTPSNIVSVKSIVNKSISNSKPIVNKLTPIVLQQDLTTNIGSGEREMLIAAAQHPEGITKQHLTVLTGKKRSTRDAYLQRLRQRGFIVQEGEKVIANEAGLEYLGSDYKPLPTGAELRDHLLRTLPEGERTILALLIDSNPEAMTREQVSEKTPYQRSTRDAYIQRLSARGLVIEESRGVVKAADKLFE